ncbi:MAG: phospholipid carrier-dependent glycosyltransferase [Ardenticatenia bacterium]|nr:phospholipid carrier-dependent glycosyltransferase [Ardenticatenia bacterium]
MFRRFGHRTALTLLLLLAAGLRLWGLERLPPGLQFDEAHNALDALRVLRGARDLFFVDNGGREPLSIYLQALSLGALGPDRPLLALRLVSALVGVSTVAVAYGWLMSFLGRRRLAMAGAGFLAFSYWHLHFSRYGIRAILAPLWTTLALWAWWRAVEAQRGSPPGGWIARSAWGGRAALACGAAMAGAVYSHPTGRLLPLVLLGHLAWLAACRRGRAPRALRSLIASSAVAFVLFIPLGLFFLAHPVWFVSHPGDVSLAAVASKDFDGSMTLTAAHQLWAVLGMFFVSGDPSAFHNLPCLPVWDPLTALLGVLGLGVLLAAWGGKSWGGRARGEGWDLQDERAGEIGESSQGPGDRGVGRDGERGRQALALDQERVVFLGLWLTVFLLPTLLSDRAPNYSRAIAALPVVVLLPALGAQWARALLQGRWPRAAALLLPAALAVAGGWTLWQYFGVFGRERPLVCGTDKRLDLYHSYDLDKRDAYAWLAGEAAKGAAVFLHPLWAEHASFAYMNRAGPVRRLDPANTLVLPAGTSDVILAAPAKEEAKEGWFDGFDPDRFTKETVEDPEGRPLLSVLRLDAGWRLTLPADAEDDPLRPERPLGVRFVDGPVLQGLTLADARPGAPLEIRLYWRAGAVMPRRWTCFVQLVGPKGQGWGQADREPGNGSLPTTAWLPGDTVIERHAPKLDAAARGELRLRLGWYDPATGERLPLAADSGGPALPGGVRAVDGGSALEIVVGELR